MRPNETETALRDIELGCNRACICAANRLQNPAINLRIALHFKLLQLLVNWMPYEKLASKQRLIILFYFLLC